MTKFYSIYEHTQLSTVDRVYFTDLKFVRDYMMANWGGDVSVNLKYYLGGGREDWNDFNRLSDVPDHELLRCASIWNTNKNDRMIFVIEEHQFED